jgi:hypothetical protein
MPISQIETNSLNDGSVTASKLASTTNLVKPSITSPANAATGIINTQLFTASPYLSLYGRSQANAQWEISTSSSFAWLNVSSTITGSNTQFQANASSGLTESTVHYIRVRYSDDANVSSEYSNTVQFTTGVFPFSTDFLVIAGGGGGGYSGAGGGGAGGYRTSAGSSGGGASAESSLLLSVSTSYTVTVGAGGAGRTDGNDQGAKGSNSVFSTITSIGGGGGGSRDNAHSGDPGGSGGGATRTSGTGGSGTANQGFNGGSNDGVQAPGCGGGGAGEAGKTNNDATVGLRGDGGAGVASSITGSSVTRAGGGGGGGGDGSNVSVGGNGGGGAGAYSATSASVAGGTNTGGGGGGGSNEPIYINGASGGSGIVIIKYPDTKTISNPGGGLTYSTTTSGGFKVTTFTAGTGTVQFS